MKAKLTEEQKQVIIDLENRFLELNSCDTKVGNYIDIGGIMDFTKRKQNWIDQIEVYKDASRKQARAIIEDAYNKLKPDLDALGLTHYLSSGSTGYNYFEMTGRDKKGNCLRFDIYLKSRRYQIHKNDEFGLEYSVDCEWSFKTGDGYFRGNNFEELISNAEFKKSLQRMYEYTVRT